MAKIRICIILIIVGALNIFAQVNNIENAKIDVFLDPTIIKSTELENVSFLNHIGISANQNLIIASNDAFYSIGYRDYVIYKTSKEISSFCFVGNEFFYSNNNALYKITDSGEEKKVTDLDFSVKQLWSGNDVIYAVSSVNTDNIIYAILPKTGKWVKVHTIQHPILGISQLGTVLFVLHENGLQSLFVKEKKVVDVPFKTKKIGKIVSMAINQRKGCIYIASENGVYKLYKKKMELIYNGTGILCDDLDGLLIFNPNVPLLLRLRNETLYSNDSITIEIK